MVHPVQRHLTQHSLLRCGGLQLLLLVLLLRLLLQMHSSHVQLLLLLLLLLLRCELLGMESAGVQERVKGARLHELLLLLLLLHVHVLLQLQLLELLRE